MSNLSLALSLALPQFICWHLLRAESAKAVVHVSSAGNVNVNEKVEMRLCPCVCLCVRVYLCVYESMWVCLCVYVCGFVCAMSFFLSLWGEGKIFVIQYYLLYETWLWQRFWDLVLSFFFSLLLPLSSPLLSSPLQVTVFPPRWQAGFSVFSSTEMLRAPCQGEARAEPSQIFSVLLESPWGRRESKWGLFLSVDLHSVFSSKCSNMPSVDYCCRFSQWVRASIVFWITEHVSVHATIFMKKLFTISL